MRTPLATLSVAVMAVATILLASPIAAAAPGDGAIVTPYEQCNEVLAGVRACTTGSVVVRVTEAASGAVSGTVVDNGRFETVDSTTGCTRTGSYQLRNTFAAGPDATEHVVASNEVRLTGRIRCEDSALNGKCLSMARSTILVLPGRATVTTKFRFDCDVQP